MLQAIDTHLLTPAPASDVRGWRRFLLEFGYFGIKEARACLFAGLFLLLFS